MAAHRQRWSEGIGYLERETFDAFLQLPAPQRKLSYKQTQALEALPKQIAALESEIAALGRRLADPNLFARDPAAFNESTTRLARAEAELAEAEHAWLELELLRDEIAHHRATTKR